MFLKLDLLISLSLAEINSACIDCFHVLISYPLSAKYSGEKLLPTDTSIATLISLPLWSNCRRVSEAGLRTPSQEREVEEKVAQPDKKAPATIKNIICFIIIFPPLIDCTISRTISKPIMFLSVTSNYQILHLGYCSTTLSTLRLNSSLTKGQTRNNFRASAIFRTRLDSSTQPSIDDFNEAAIKQSFRYLTCRFTFPAVKDFGFVILPAISRPINPTYNEFCFLTSKFDNSKGIFKRPMFSTKSACLIL